MRIATKSELLFAAIAVIGLCGQAWGESAPSALAARLHKIDVRAFASRPTDAHGWCELETLMLGD